MEKSNMNDERKTKTYEDFKKGDFNALRSLIRKGFNFERQEFKYIRDILYKFSNKYYLVYFKSRAKNSNWSKAFNLSNKEYTDQISKLLLHKYWEDKIMSTGSDGIDDIIVSGLYDIKFKKLKIPVGSGLKQNLFKNKEKRIEKNGKFFKYINTTNIDLERYQILKKDSKIEIVKENCLIHSLRLAGVEDIKLKSVLTTIKKGSYISKKDLKSISEIIGKSINLYTMSNREKRNIDKTVYNPKLGNNINIALYQNHYFIFETTKYTKKSIKNYSKEKDEIETIKKGLKINSLELIYILFKDGYFIEDPSYLTKIESYEQVRNLEIDNLDNIENEQELFKYQEKDKLDTPIFYADTETQTSGERHIPIMIGVVDDRKESTLDHVRIFMNNPKDDGEMFNNFLKYIYKRSNKTKNVIVYFHNLKYDYNVILPYLYLTSAPCEKDGMIYSVKILGYQNQLIELRDSYKLATFALSKFQQTFGLSEDLRKQEAIAYDYYNLNNLDKTNISIDHYETFFKTDEEKKKFREILKKDEYTLEVFEEGFFNPIEYYKYYLRYDCEVLKRGIHKFKETIDKLTKNKLNIHNFLTISSLTYAYMGLNGAFDNMYQVSGCLRDFLSKAVMGGRVDVNEVYKKKLIETKTADYDGVSMYPSAIKRASEERGFPIGKCKRLNTKDFKEIKKYNYSILKIKINKINKFQQMPMVCYKNKDGIMEYINQIENPIISYVDIITLEDWIEFCDIEYEILDGVYYDEGVNRKFGELVENLFKERLKYKSEKNEAMQQILKLMMNSAYGKTIMKKSYTSKKIIIKKNEDNYIYNNFNTIRTIEKLNRAKQKIIEEDSIDTSYNLSQVGVMVLSYSKRIMNEVFNIANNNKIPIYYTDTDSMHLPFNKVSKLERKFKEFYKRNLNGKNLCEFHIDFNLEGATGEIYASKSLFLGKKCYIDILEGKNEKGELIKGNHIRMKGVNFQGLQHRCNETFKGDFLKMYKYLAKGNEVNFILNPEGYKPSFDFKHNKVCTINTGEFIRTVKF